MRGYLLIQSCRIATRLRNRSPNQASCLQSDARALLPSFPETQALCPSDKQPARDQDQGNMRRHTPPETAAATSTLPKTRLGGWARRRRIRSCPPSVEQRIRRSATTPP